MITATITTSIIGAILTMVALYWVRLGRPMVRPRQEIRDLAREAAEAIASPHWDSNVMVPEHQPSNYDRNYGEDSPCGEAGMCVARLTHTCPYCKHAPGGFRPETRMVTFQDMVRARMAARMDGWSQRDVQRFRLYHAQENQAMVQRDRALAGVQAVSENLGRDRAAAKRGRAELNGETDD